MTTIKSSRKKSCEVCGNEISLDNFQTGTIENKDMSMCPQCVDHIEGNNQKLSDLQVASKKCHGHKTDRQRMPKQKTSKRVKATEKFRY